MILHALDTVYLYIKVEEINDEFQKVILTYIDKKETSENLENEVVILGKNAFRLCTGQDRFYNVSIQNDYYHIHFSLEPKFNNIPHIKIKISQLALWSFDLEYIYQYFLDILKHYNQTYLSMPLNRVDFCCHTDTLQFKETWNKKILTSANIKDYYFEGDTFSGLNIGSREGIFCRIYNKSLEIKKKKKMYFEDIWIQNGWNKEKDIWNIEFELKREQLKEFNILDYTDLLKYDNLLSVWKYLTNDYITLRKENKKDKNKSRWKINNDWIKIQAWEGCIVDSALREKKVSLDIKYNKAQIIGNMVSLIAKKDGEFSSYHQEINNIIRDTDKKKLQKKLLSKRILYMDLYKKNKLLENPEVKQNTK